MNAPDRRCPGCSGEVARERNGDTAEDPGVALPVDVQVRSAVIGTAEVADWMCWVDGDSLGGRRRMRPSMMTLEQDGS